MQMYHIALFFAVVGILTGVVDYAMDGAGGDNWFDAPVPDMNIIELTEDDINDMQFEDGSAFEIAESTPKYINIFIKAIQGVLLITTILGHVLYYDVGGSNVFLPVLIIFQLAIWFVYVAGIVQFVLNRSMKGME